LARKVQQMKKSCTSTKRYTALSQCAPPGKGGTHRRKLTSAAGTVMAAIKGNATAAFRLEVVAYKPRHRVDHAVHQAPGEEYPREERARTRAESREGT
jgi:hypothetical protein